MVEVCLYNLCYRFIVVFVLQNKAGYVYSVIKISLLGEMTELIEMTELWIIKLAYFVMPKKLTFKIEKRKNPVRRQRATFFTLMNNCFHSPHYRFD